MQHSTRDDFVRYPLQLGRLLADPLLGLWVDQDQIEAFGVEELAVMDPLSAQVAKREADWCRLIHQSQARVEGR